MALAENWYNPPYNNRFPSHTGNKTYIPESKVDNEASTTNHCNICTYAIEVKKSYQSHWIWKKSIVKLIRSFLSLFKEKDQI